MLLGDEETPAPKWLGTTMNHSSGFRARSGPVIQATVSAGVAVNQVGHTTTLSFRSFRVPTVA